ncbi:MAG TPA: DinB family protein [Acidobacteriaceae bacterium]|nr:DinB family protein [Acidobacteriaceae bacterium]
MAVTETTENALATVLAKRWESAAKKFMDLAAALPDEKFEKELVKGTRTCGAVLRHVAYWNRYIADSLHGRKADDSGNELAREQFPDKAGLLRELKKSSREISGGIGRALDGTSMDLIAMALEHLSEHYGQLVVYARLTGVTPPASQG